MKNLAAAPGNGDKSGLLLTMGGGQTMVKKRDTYEETEA